MSNLNILQLGVPDEFRARSMESYLQSATDKYSNLISLINDLSIYDCDDYHPDFDDLSEEDQATGFNAIVNEKLSEYNMTSISECPITFSNGFIKLKDLCYNVLVHFEKYARPDEKISDPIFEEEIQLSDAAGVTTNNKLTVMEMITEIKDNLISSIAMVAAISSSTANTVGERITVFNDKISTVLNNAYNASTGAVGYFRNLINSPGASCHSILTTISQSCGLNSRTISGAQSLAQSTEIHNFTGSSPVATLDFSTLGRTIATTGAIVIDAGRKVINGILNIGKKIFNFAKDKIKAVTTDPKDLYVLNEKAEAYSIDGWQYQEDYETFFSDGWLNLIFEASNIIDLDDRIAYLNNPDNGLINRWFKSQTLFGEIMVYPYNYFHHTYDTIGYKAKILIKPYVLNPRVIVPMIKECHILADEQNATFNNSTCSFEFPRIVTIGSNINITDIENFLEQCQNNNIYQSDVTDEQACFCGLYLSRQLMLWFWLNYWNDYSETPWLMGLYSSITIPSTITNKMFIQSASGWNGDTDNPVFSLTENFGTIHFDDVANLSLISDYFLMSIIRSKINRDFYDLDYDYVPYTVDSESFSTSMFSVHTDSDNNEAFSKFLENVIITTAVAITAITAFKIIKRLRIKKQFKRMVYVGMRDNDMWNGKKLSYKQMNKYVKYSRKLNASTLLTGGLASDTSGPLSTITSQFSSVADPNSYTLTTIVDLIH